MNYWIVTLTNFGDSAVLLPLAAVFTGWMMFERAWRSVALWLALFVGAMVLVVGTKLAFIGWGLGIESLDFTGFSGHTMLSSSVYPSLLVWMAQRRGRNAQVGAWLLGSAFAIAIGISRVVLHMHSSSEVVGGYVLGGTVSLLWAAASALDAKPHPYQFAVLMVIAVMVGSLHGQRAPTQGMITQVAMHLSGRTVPFNRYNAWPQHYRKPGSPSADMQVLWRPAAAPR